MAVTFADKALAQVSAQAIGQVETIQGSATATRLNRSVSNLRLGDPIFTGDTVQTGLASTLGITFLDQTVFSLAANARMVVNNLVYNPQGPGSNLAINLVEGGFVFLAGKIAANGAMNVDTPVAQIGIRGTLPWVTVGATTSFAILSERDGKTGEYQLFRKGTNTVIGTVNLATVGTTRKLVMNAPTDTPQIVDKTPEELAAEQVFRSQIFNTLGSRDTRLGIAPNPNPGNQVPGRNQNPTPGDQGQAPGTGPANNALLQQANAIVGACRQAQAKTNNALQLYHSGNHEQSRQLLQEAGNDVSRLPPQSCGGLLNRIFGGQRALGEAERDGHNAQSAINSCNENEIYNLRNKYAASGQISAAAILARLDQAAQICAARRVQQEKARNKAQANAECRRRNGRGSYAGRIRANGSYKCHLTRKERSRRAWAECRRKYGRRLANVKIYKNGNHRCIPRRVVHRPPPRQPRRQNEQYHNSVTSAAIIGGILGGFGNNYKKPHAD